MQNSARSSASFGNINYGAATSLGRSASVTFYSGATRHLAYSLDYERREGTTTDVTDRAYGSTGSTDVEEWNENYPKKSVSSV